jgi:hypothetical protein
MLYREIIAVCSEIHTKHINTLYGQNVELLNVKLAVHLVTNGVCVAVPWRKATLWNSYAVPSLSCRCTGRAICSLTVLCPSEALCFAGWRSNGVLSMKILELKLCLNCVLVCCVVKCVMWFRVNTTGCDIGDDEYCRGRPSGRWVWNTYLGAWTGCKGVIECVCLCSGMQVLEHSRQYIHVSGQDSL